MGQAPVRDIGVPDLSWGTWGSGLLSDWWETSAELIWPQSVTTYGRMRHDPQLKAVIQAYFLPLLRANWVLDPAGCRDEVVERCSDGLGIGILGADSAPGPARRRGVVWSRHLRQALGNLVYGYMPFELRYRVEGGQTLLDNLGARMPWTLAEIKLNRDATIREIVQTTQREPIPAQRLVWYVTGQEGANWAGISMLRPAYGAWLLKHETWRVHATSIRRFGMGVPYVEAPAGATAAQVAQARDLAQAMRAGEQSGAGLPAGFRPALMGLTGSVPDALGFIRYLDQAMAKMALSGLIELGQTETGSRALGETFLDLFLLSLQAVADEVAATATSGQEGTPGIITDLVDQNWGEGEPAPRIVCADVGENYQVTAEALATLVAAKALTPTRELEEWIRRTWRLPELPEETPGAATVAPVVPGGPGQPGGPGESPPVPGPSPAGPTPAPAALPPGSQAPPAAASAPALAVAAATAPGGLRRALTEAEVRAGFDPARLAADWASTLEGLVAAYRPVLRAVRAGLVDKVIAALEAGRIDRLAALDPEPGGGAAPIQVAMVAAAREASRGALAEAGQQGVHIAAERVKVDEERLGRLAQVWAAMAARRLGRLAGQKAAQVITAAPLRPQAGAVGDEVAASLEEAGDGPLRDDLGAAVSAGQHAGRMAVLEAAPAAAGRAEYHASEILDRNTCGPCRRNDGEVYATLGEAEAAYPTGGFLHCEGMFRCRGTVVAVWSPGQPPRASVRAAAAPAETVLLLEALAVDEGLARDVEAAAGAWAAKWDPEEHPRVPGGEHGGEFTHTPGGPSAPSDLVPSGEAPKAFPRARADVTRRIGDELVAQMPGWKHELHRWARGKAVPLEKVHMIQTLDPAEVRHRMRLVKSHTDITDAVAVYDKQTDRFYILDQGESAEAWRRLGYTSVLMQVMTPEVHKTERGAKPGGGLNRATVDTWFRWGIQHWDLPPEVKRHMERGRANFRRNTDEGDASAIESIRMASGAAEVAGDKKLADKLNNYAVKMEAARAPRPGPSGAPGPEGSRIDRAELDAWLGAVATDPDVVSTVQRAARRAKVALLQGRDDEAGMALIQAAAIAESVGESGALAATHKALAPHLREAGQALNRAHAEAHKNDLRLKSINQDAGKAVLEMRGHIGDIIGTQASRFHGVIDGSGRSQSINGTMGWAGEMTLNRQRVAKAMEDFAAGRPGSTDGFRTVVHELLHAAGEGVGGSQDGMWYGYTRSAKEVEEGFTELGARLISGEVAARMGWSDRTTKLGRDLSVDLARYGQTGGLRSMMGIGTYHAFVSTAWAWCEDVAAEEGLTGSAKQKRARELAIAISGKQSAAKVAFMADMLIAARGRKPGEVVKSKAAGTRTLHDLMVDRIQQTWKGSSKKQAAPIGPLLAGLASDGVKL